MSARQIRSGATDSIDVLTAAFAGGKQISEIGQPPVKTAKNVDESYRDLDLLGIERFGRIDRYLLWVMNRHDGLSASCPLL